MAARRIAIVGDALLDVIVAPLEPMRRGADVPATIRIEPGGQGANLAVRLARRGADVRLVCALADDGAGRLVRERLAADDVDVRPVPVAATGSVVVLIESDASRSMLSQRVPFGASVDLSLLADEVAWLVISGYVLLEAAVRLVAGVSARRAVVGCAVDAERVESWSAAVAGVGPDLVILNADEAAAIAPGLGQRQAAAALAARWRCVVAVTGSGEAVVAAGDETFERAVDAGPAVDSTGAGDAYAAALIGALAAGAWPPDRAAVAHAMAAAADAAAAVAATVGAQAHVSGERLVKAS